MVSTPTPPDPWAELRAHTPARIALGRSGASLPTDELLRFGVAHAQARDAVHLPFDVLAVRAGFEAHGFETLEVESASADRATYLQRPDLGRRLSAPSRESLCASRAEGALVCVVGDGLSSSAIHRHALALMLELRPRLEGAGWALGPVVLARQARVALGDEVGALSGAAMVLMLIGERPGLSSPDSLGAYLTWAPRVGCLDADRNCVSNIRPEGLAYGPAAEKLSWLAAAARTLCLTGVKLKDESDGGRLGERLVAQSAPARGDHA